MAQLTEKSSIRFHKNPDALLVVKTNDDGNESTRAFALQKINQYSAGSRVSSLVGVAANGERLEVCVDHYGKYRVYLDGVHYRGSLILAPKADCSSRLDAK